MRTSDMNSYRYRSPQELHLLSILAQTASRQASGCLRVTSESNIWMLYLERGKLVYASNSLDPFGRLDRYLRRLSAQIPSLASPVRVQVRLLFEKPIEEDASRCWDYEAICWLVGQQYLTPAQAAELIETLAKDVLETLLPLQLGNYDLLAEGQLAQLPRFCHIDLRSLVESCQVRRLRQQNSNPAKAPVPTPQNSLRLQEKVLQQNAPALQNLSQSAIPTATEEKALPPREARSPASVQRATYTVACIDDSPTVLNAIESFLDDKAFRVLRIENPVSALMQIIRNKPELILLDVTMPNLDGYELCSLLRRHPLFRQTPIIMVTGNTGLIDRAKAKLVGASGYLTKPFTQPDLLKMMFKYLR
ncbi:MAG: response regulator [Leptolyngbyaceae cyanobacterium RM2_2_21]|nr:response regulator [Leptolyngbyaceae cyanobacterium RM2_2_21]